MILEIGKISFSYKSSKVLEDLSFGINEGEVLSLLGPNGVGKTTLMKCINRILLPRGGTVMVNGNDVSRMNKNEIAKSLGYVAQRGETSKMTVFDSVLLGRKPHIEWSVTDKDLAITERVIRLVGLEKYALKYVDEMSGGEYQIVQIARALVQQPKVMLLDEPTSNLDLSNQHKIMHLVGNVVRSNNMGAVITMHDLNLAIRHSDKFILMKDGKICFAGGHEVITAENIGEVYGLDVCVENIRGIPTVVPL